jgi:hypothetical protein
MSLLRSRQMFQIDLNHQIIPQQRQVCPIFTSKSLFSDKIALITCNSGDKGQPKESCTAKIKRASRIKRVPAPIPTKDHFDNDSDEFKILKTTSPFRGDDNWKISADGKGYAIRETVSTIWRIMAPLSNLQSVLYFCGDRSTYIHLFQVLVTSISFTTSEYTYHLRGIHR